MKKIIILVCCILTLQCTMLPVYADGNKDVREIEAMDDSIDKQIEEYISGQQAKSVPEYTEYRYDKGTPVYVRKSHYAGNQPTNGTRFTTGGGFYWNPNGGPTSTVSLGASFGGATISMNFGVVSTDATAYFCTAPNTTDYFKLKVTLKYKVVPTEVYGKRLDTGIWVYLYTIYPKSLYSQSLTASKVA